MEWDAGAIATIISVIVVVLLAAAGTLWGVIRYLLNKVLEQFSQSIESNSQATNDKIDETKEQIKSVDERLTSKVSRQGQELEDLKRTTAHQVDESRVREMFLEQFTPFREESRSFQRDTKAQLNQIQEVVKSLAVSVAVHDDRLYYPRPMPQPMQPFYAQDHAAETAQQHWTRVRPQTTQHQNKTQAPGRTAGQTRNQQTGTDNNPDGTDYC